MDIRLTDPGAYVCAIHWQVAQATSLENIEFYMQYNSDNPGNTQQVRALINPDMVNHMLIERLRASIWRTAPVGTLPISHLLAVISGIASHPSYIEH